MSGQNCVLALPFVLIGFFLMAGGWFGKVSAEVIQAAFSRQREYLADAFAAQFTRNPKALAEALKKVYSLPRKGIMKSGQSLPMKSFFIVSPARFQGLFGSHPPIKKRIKLLDPKWDGNLIPVHLPDLESLNSRADEAESRMVISAYLSKRVDGEVWRAFFDAAAKPGENKTLHFSNSLELARSFLAGLPGEIVSAAAGMEKAPALTLALFIQAEPRLASAQRDIIRDLMSERVAAEAWRLSTQLTRDIRLPVLDLLLPSLYRLSRQSGYSLTKAAKAMAKLDSKLDFFEIAALHLLRRYLPAGEVFTDGSPGEGEIQKAAVNLLSIVAYVGHTDLKSARAAFTAGAVAFRPRSSFKMAPVTISNSFDLAKAFATLQNEDVEYRKRLILAAVRIVEHDRQVKISEYELLRTMAAALEFPLPLLPSV